MKHAGSVPWLALAIALSACGPTTASTSGSSTHAGAGAAVVPGSADGDGDGIVDRDDACPQDPGPAPAGCPAPAAPAAAPDFSWSCRSIRPAGGAREDRCWDTAAECAAAANATNDCTDHWIAYCADGGRGYPCWQDGAGCGDGCADVTPERRRKLLAGEP